MDFAERLLPGEQLIKGYPELRVDRRGGFAGLLTTRRLFLQGKRRQFDIDPSQVNYIERCRAQRFSSLWLLLSLIFIGVAALMFIIFLIMLPLWYFIRREALVIGTPARKWIIFGEPAMLDDLAHNLRLNQAVRESGGSQQPLVRDAEPVYDPVAESLAMPPPKAEVRAVNESWPRAALRSLLLGAFLFYYLTTFGAPLGIIVFLCLVVAGHALWVLRGREAHNRHHGLAPRTGGFWIGWLWPLRVLLLLRWERLAPLRRLRFRTVIRPRGIWVGWLTPLRWTRLPAFAGLHWRRVEPWQPTGWSFALAGRRWRLRSIGSWTVRGLLVLGLLWTLGAQNLRPLLFAVALGAPLYLGCRAFAARPCSRGRLARRAVAAAMLALMIMLPPLAWAPLFLPATAALPGEQVQGDDGNGWEVIEHQTVEKMLGLGLVEVQVSVYVDDGRDADDDYDGYFAILIVVALKLPLDLEEKILLDVIEKQFKDRSIDEEINLTAHILNGTRKTAQGYPTQYFIYNATAKNETLDVGTYYSHPVTEGAEMRYIGEAWKAPEMHLLVVTIGIAIISTENPETTPPPPGPLPGPVKDLWEQAGEMKDELIPDPTDTTDTRNWVELLDLIPQVKCEGGPD